MDPREIETRAVWPCELEIRARGRGNTLRGRFPYSRGPGDRMATVASRGRTRKERVEADAFGWQMREFAKLQNELGGMLQESVDKVVAEKVQALRQQLERRNVHILAGHSYDRPLGDMLRGGATVTSSREAVDFEVELPDPADRPSYMEDTVRQVRAGLVGGVSPGFAVPPSAVVANAERLEPEPGNPAVQVRVIREAVLFELSLVTRPAYSETDVDVRRRVDAAVSAPPPSRRRLPWWRV